MKWMLFILGKDKTPLPNCAKCAEAGPDHDRETCGHLFCHGFYAASDDPERFAQMRKLRPDGYVALRTGEKSGVIVLDAEGRLDEKIGVKGTDVLDDWENWSGGWPLTPTGRIASTPSGGVHRYYRWEPGVKSRNRVLPHIDLKSDGGYVVIPTPESTDRGWIAEGEPGVLDANMLNWMRTARGRRSAAQGMNAVGHGPGYDFERFRDHGCPGGMRDEFFNELIFRMRKMGMTRQMINVETKKHWDRCGQPGNELGAIWYMPYHHVEYKIERIWRTVEVEEITPEQMEIVAHLVKTATKEEPATVGRSVLVQRNDVWVAL